MVRKGVRRRGKGVGGFFTIPSGTQNPLVLALDDVRTLNERESAVLNLELNSIQLLSAGDDVEQVNNDGLVGSQEGAIANQGNDRVADVTSSSSHQNSNGLSLTNIMEHDRSKSKGQ